MPFWRERQSEGRSSVFEHHLRRLVRKGPTGRHGPLWFESDSEQCFPVGTSWLGAGCCSPALPTLLQMLPALLAVPAASGEPPTAQTTQAQALQMSWAAKDGSSDPAQKHPAENWQTDLQPTENLTQGNLSWLHAASCLHRIFNLNYPIRSMKWKENEHLGMQYFFFSPDSGNSCLRNTL